MISKNDNFLITGAAGFIGSCAAKYLNREGYENLILADDFSKKNKLANHQDVKCIARVDRDDLEKYLGENRNIQFVIHLGARTDTTEMDYSIHEKLNLNFSKMIWNYCSLNQIPLVYASSAATYGNGEFGYDDNHLLIEKLQPLNPYGVSKNEFDKWVLVQINAGMPAPPRWYGLKFFNVYGPNEYHKGRMASVILHAYEQIITQGKITLFRSHNPHYKDGEQMRDFIYVKDILFIIRHLLEDGVNSGIYNAGTGKASTFIELAQAIFNAIGVAPNIEFVDTPQDIREKYQYFTEAKMDKLLSQWPAGSFMGFSGIEEGIRDYVNNYLKNRNYY